jgi:AMMECR1 domain-containing protein
MSVHKLISAVALAIASLGSPGFCADPEPVAPVISTLDQRFLTKLVRQTVAQEIRDGSTYDPGYVPPSLRGTECQMIVTLRQHGHVRGRGAGAKRPIMSACRDAALAALADAESIGPVSLEWLGRVRIEIEAVGDPTPVNFTGQWSDRTAFSGIIEPGVHGMLLQYGQAHKQFCPSEIISKSIEVHDAVRNLAQQLVQVPEDLAEADVFRFRTTHWHELSPGGDVVQLRRGVVLIGQDAVTNENLARTIQRLADYMIYRQLPSGWFSYQYEPSGDTYVDEDNLVRQAGVAWSLAHHASLYNKSASAGAAEMAIDALADRVLDLRGVDDVSFVAGKNGLHKLGLTALTTLAMFDHPKADKYADARSRMVNGIHWLQRPSGKFVTAFPPSPRLSGQYYFPGEALLALARAYEEQPSQRGVDAFNSAFGFYQQLFEDDPTPPFVPWQTQAFVRMALRTKRRDYADFVFEMNDWLMAKQYNESNCPWPELHGGVAAYEGLPAGVATAAYLEGFADALRLARSRGDTSRAERYDLVVRRAARFVMQLQFRPEEAYYVRSLPDTAWGIRTTLSRNRLRIDHCQHALMALIKTRQVLFGEPR